MPRDIGTGLYHYPEGTPGNPAQTIFSTRYNTFINDLTNTLNQALPINMGGTGGDNAITARDNLDAEVAAQQVTNYNSHTFEAGSFFSNASAIGAPVASHFFSGICHKVASDNMFLEARDYDDPDVKHYIREMHDGVWGAWVSNQSLSDTRYVNVTGDLMTGNLTIKMIEPILALDATGASTSSVRGYRDGKTRWTVITGNAATETGGNVGSDFAIGRYNDAGDTVLGFPFAIARSTGQVTLQAPVLVNGGTLTVGATSPALYLIASGTTAPQIIGAKGTSANPFWQMQLGTDAAGHFTISRYSSGALVDTPLTLAYDTGRAAFAKGAQFSTDANFFIATVGTDKNFNFKSGWRFLFEEANGTLNWYGDAGGTLKYKSWYNGDFQIGGGNAAKVGGGAWVDSSDARIKTVVGPYEHGLTELKQVAPVRYKFKGNSVAGVSTDTVPPPEDKRPDHQDATAKEFIGVVAQQIEVPLPETVYKVPGRIDGAPVTDLRIFDPGALTYALINAVKELAARVETLEARLDGGVAAATDVAVSVKNSMQAIPDNFTATNFAAMKIQLDALTEALAAMLQAQAAPP